MGITLPKPQIDYYGILSSLYILFISRLYYHKSKQAFEYCRYPNFSDVASSIPVLTLVAISTFKSCLVCFYSHSISGCLLLS